MADPRKRTNSTDLQNDSKRRKLEANADEDNDDDDVVTVDRVRHNISD